MSRSLVCWPQPGKRRSLDVLSAFAAGWGGGSGEAFYGVVGIEAVFAKTRESAKTWFYGDNAYFDRLRGTHFRFARDALQIAEAQRPDWARWRAIGLGMAPWQRGRHVVVVEQSSHHLRLSGGGEAWLGGTLTRLASLTDRPIRVRRWNRDKGGAASSLAADLKDAHALVTHTSAAANEALLAGVPVFVTGPCAASPLASGSLEGIESPRYPDGREEWAAGLANSQWTLEELRSGAAWRRLVDRR